ncbi:hypothetical protein HYH03_011121 [Edaphochlamys debaryana]|uniref:Uncharacterized protein n=1 Tax=Edaphochlamys debaryana TaxID=47281 RepID=A0A836BVI7_9CHLO|nr:hypothetical protein HYH03_011121 [Edaphochlamys debaryana]|eukprot:KAG2490495.1 hypothetical protein HYH03_011121 [Edaphochlamys debaryana]
MTRQEELLVGRYGKLQLKKTLLCGKRQTRRYFDSADWALAHEGKPLPDDMLLQFEGPMDQLPHKTEPTAPLVRGRSNLDTVGWAEPATLPVHNTRTVIDI